MIKKRKERWKARTESPTVKLRTVLSCSGRYPIGPGRLAAAGPQRDASLELGKAETVSV